MDDNILFYSEKCPFCIQCLELLKSNADKINFIGYVNIHKSKGSLPLRVRRVPTLIVNGGETIHEGRDVYLWIYGLVNMIQTQQEPKKEKDTSISDTNETAVVIPTKEKELQTVWSSSTLVGNNETASYSSISNNKTITETINYSKIKPVAKDQEKLTLSPDSIQDLRNSELEKIRPNPIKRI